MAKRHSPHGGHGVAYPYRDSIEGVPPTLVNFRCPTGCGPRPGTALPFRAFLPCFSVFHLRPEGGCACFGLLAVRDSVQRSGLASVFPWRAWRGETSSLSP